MEYLNFQQEKDVILWSLINETFGKNFAKKDRGPREEIGLELYITPKCNQNCSYCYLCKYGNELYPPEIQNENVILENLEIMLNHCLKNNWNPFRFDFFTGEIWDTEFGYKVYEVTEKAIKNGFKPNILVIPTNMSFLLSDKAIEKAEHFMEVCKSNGVKPCYSCSNDGFLIDLETRPLNSPNDYQYQKGTEEYYDKLFKFCKKWDLGFHPMVAAHCIEKWGENYIWWEEKLKQYDFKGHPIMYLEVRNDDWTDEKIESYLKYLNTSIDYELNNKCEGSIEKFNDVIRRRGMKTPVNYSPMHLDRNELEPGCTVHRSLVVRLGDLAIVPCHRTSYEEFVGGHFKTEEKEIVGVNAKNIQVLNQVWLNNMAGNAKCGACNHRMYCMKGCYGAQFESTGELLYPIESVCELFKAKNYFLYFKYNKLGILNENSDNHFKKSIEQDFNKKEFIKWKPIIERII